MTTTLTPAPEQKGNSSFSSLKSASLPQWASPAFAIAAVVVAVIGAFTVGPLGVVVGWLVAAAVPLWSRVVEGPRKALDRLATYLIVSSFALALIPLASILWSVVSNGVQVFSAEFFTYSMRNVVGEGGGIYHAMIGTLLITGMAALMSIPVGLFTAIYLIEYGEGTRIAHTIRFLVDVMTGIPSIVAGLFAYALLAIFFGEGVRMGFGGSIALTVLMLPTVVRSSEEMLKLVPNELREASYALGVPKWATIAKVVLPTALAGIVTGITLAIARVIGETAPLLVIAGATDSVNFNLFDGRMATLPVFTYFSITNPGVPPEPSIARGWGAALTLLIMVMLLNLIARLVSHFFSPKGER